MGWCIPDGERAYLRDLARMQAEYAALSVMTQRKQMWYDLNDSHPSARPPVIIETWTFDRDFLPASILKCNSDIGRQIEKSLLRNIRNHELIDDDKVIPDTFDIDWFVDIDEFGVIIETTHIKDAQEVETGFEFRHPIQDLERDLDLLKPAVCRVDRELTAEWWAFLTDLLGDILPVRIRSDTSFGSTMLTYRVIQLMGMQAFYMAMVDSPEATHQLMAFLRDNALRIMRWAESEGLLRVNNGNQESFGSSYNFTTQLPAPDYRGGPARLKDMWGNAEAEEMIGVSPAMFHEFCFPYYRDICEPFGLLYYGCCEPAHPFWDDICQLPHLKKISISPWCDQAYMGQALQGTDLVFSRKPDPNFLSVEERLDEEAWAAHIRETLEVTKGVLVEFIIRDVYTLHGDLRNARLAVEIARREITQHYHP